MVGSIDEDKLQAQAFTRERKLAVARALVRIADRKYGIPPEDIIIDPLVFPCATGDENYIGGAVETIEGIRLMKENAAVRQNRAGHLEHLVRTAGRGTRSGQLGLPLLLHQGRAGPGHRQRREAGALRVDSRGGAPPGRKPAVQHAAGGVPPDRNASLLERRRRTGAQQTTEQKAAVNQYHIAAITEHFRGAAKQEKAKTADLPLDQRLANYIIRRHERRPDSRSRPQARRKAPHRSTSSTDR